MIRKLDRWILLALALPLVPFLLLAPLGFLWIWERGLMPVWLGLLVALAAAGFGVQLWLRRRERRLLAESVTQADPTWPPSAEGAWEEVRALADRVDPETWPLRDSGRVFELGRHTLETVARHYHPQAQEPLLELTAPDVLLVVSRASRDLRATLLEQVPFSHSLRVGALVRASRWVPIAEHALALYRAGRLVVNPVGALLGELWEHLRGRSFNLAREELERWLLRELVLKVGSWGIDLYSGRLPLTDEAPELTRVSAADLERVQARPTRAAEPLRILVMGRANAGKSSLINALFGELKVATDALPDTAGGLVPLRLAREGMDSALILDSPGIDTEALSRAALRAAAADADLLLWVTPAHRPDRAGERALLDDLRAAFAARPARRAPPLLVAVGHIDRLRPAREWHPPYDLTAPEGKGANIAAAVAAAAEDLAVPVADAIPVCLAEGRVYNVEDSLWAAILDRLGEAERARLLRLQDAERRERQWSLVRRQLAGAGRFLLELPGRLKGRG